MIKYNSSNIIVGQLKEILASYNLPSCKVLNDGDKLQIVKGCTYIYNGMTLVANRSIDFLTSGFTYVTTDFRFINYYREKLPILNVTHNLHIENNYYDEKTHLGLGNYLRYQRDYFGLDLMPMYNCFSGQLASNVRINFELNGAKVSFDTSTNTNKIYVVPVKLWKNYDIYFENVGKVEMCCGVYRNGNLVSKKEFEDLYISFAKDTYFATSNPRFDTPVTYSKLKNYNTININDTTNKRELIYRNEDNLCLFIKVPCFSNSSLVVIEHSRDIEKDEFNEIIGLKSNLSNFTFDDNAKNNFMHITRQVTNWMPVPEEEQLEFFKQFDLFLTRSQLTKLNDKAQHPFADRLIEYIMKNTIDSRDDILTNSKLVQQAMINKGILTQYNQNYLWDNKLRSIIYLLANMESAKANITDIFYDIYGYVDKDIEVRLPLLTGYDDIKIMEA